MSSFSIWHWLIVLIVVIVTFSTKSIGSAGTNAGGAVRNLKEIMNSNLKEIRNLKENTTPMIWTKLLVASILLVYILATLAGLASR